MDSKKYTLVDNVTGAALARGLTAEQVMMELLSYDGHEYEIRFVGDAWQLYTSRGSRNSRAGLGPMSESWANGKLCRSSAADEAQARAEIAEHVVGAEWVGRYGPEVMLDADYDDLEADEITR